MQWQKSEYYSKSVEEKQNWGTRGESVVGGQQWGRSHKELIRQRLNMRFLNLHCAPKSANVIMIYESQSNILG